VSLAAGAITLAGVTLGVAIGRTDRLTFTAFVFPIAVIAATWLIGDNLRIRRAYVAELEDKAERAEADRAAEAGRAASEERARIARELHDVVVHHVSVIAVQAGAARMLAERSADAGNEPEQWASVEATARQALTELRDLLGVLRRDNEPPTLSPQPGLEQLDRLLDDTRAAGLPVEVKVEGRPLSLPSAVDLSAYRIVQEALTNVLKHQGPAPTTVLVRYGSHDLDIEVANREESPPAGTAADQGRGHGLIGMQERVAMLGGKLHSGPRVDGTFVVAAHIPLDDAGK
jgi:signal transduction histidine kinase